VAIRIGQYWRAVMSGNVFLSGRFRTAEHALRAAAHSQAVETAEREPKDDGE